MHTICNFNLTLAIVPPITKSLVPYLQIAPVNLIDDTNSPDMYRPGRPYYPEHYPDASTAIQMDHYAVPDTKTAKVVNRVEPQGEEIYGGWFDTTTNVSDGLCDLSTGFNPIKVFKSFVCLMYRAAKGLLFTNLSINYTYQWAVVLWNVWWSLSLKTRSITMIVLS